MCTDIMDLDKLNNTYNIELKKIENANTNTLKRCQDAIALCRHQLSLLKDAVKAKVFQSRDDEIHFFKKIKQIPFNCLIYYLEVYAFESQCSKINEDHRQKFTDRVKNKTYQFLMDHLDFVNYMEQGQTHLDMCFFTRSNAVQIMMMHKDDYFYDLDFNTSHDLLLAKVTAYRKFIDYLESRSHHGFNLIQHSKLKWTSSKVALTELIYALYHSRVINNGKLEIKEIAVELQKLFNIELGDFYKIYSEIRLRKHSRTKFLDEMSYSLINEIEKNDS
ncbi:RteC domain-containing protein [Algibacter agarivorans]|uniref:RteC domain-containing protein n=1 Tax=Algibacter agarivorans TaxID=1109741 RepID=A0ABP9GVQ5_9FLAO